MDVALPSAFVQQMRSLLGSEYPDFEHALGSSAPISLRINRSKLAATPQLAAVAGHPDGYFLPERPSFTGDPWFHSGTYYVQEASSMSVALPLAQHIDTQQPLRVLDLCGAPGGKSTTLVNALNEDSLLVTNEVVKARAQILAENMTKWGAPNTVVTHTDPIQFQGLGEFFDVVVVDAPCSGEGLFRRDPAAREEWSPENVALCSDRQRRILSDIWPTVKPGGLLIYSTCTYNTLENEDNVAWMEEQLGAESLLLTFPEAMPVKPSVRDGVAGYHFYPHHTVGEGFFLAAMRKPGHWAVSTPGKLKKTKLTLAKKTELPALQSWLLDSQTWDGFWQGDTLHAVPAHLLSALDQLARHVYIVQAGLPAAERTKKHPNPTPNLALSTALKPEVFPLYNLSLAEAQAYLMREPVLPAGAKPGWVRVGYEGQSLGWVKALPNRANNYWPAAWRIRKTLTEDDQWSLRQLLP